MKALVLSGAWSVGSSVRGLSVADPRVAVLDNPPTGPGDETPFGIDLVRADPINAERSAEATSRVWAHGGRRPLATGEQRHLGVNRRGTGAT